MNTLFILFAILSGVGVLVYLRAPLMLATIASGIGLFVLNKIAIGFLSHAVMLVVGLAWVAVAAMNFAGLRKKFFTGPLFNFFRQSMPTVSQTEQAALDAGTVWWDAELFSGTPDWQKLLSLSPENLTDEEQAFLDGPTEKLCEMVNDWEISRRGDLPPEVWAYIREEGFLGMIIPKSYGGKGFSARAHSRVIMKIASRCGTAAVSVMVPNSLGPAELLMKYGTDAQRDHYLPRLADGTDIPCFALTNPHAGSDAASIPDRGIVCVQNYQGEETLGVRITWDKRYITLGPVATVLGLAFHMYDPDGILGEREDVGITLALLPTDHDGVEIGRRHFPANQSFQNGPNSGDDVFIPMEWVIGGEERCGDGWRMLMNCLAVGRSISLPGSSTAALKMCARTTGAYARVRKQFNVPIGKFEGVQEAISRIVANTYMIDAARDVTAGALDAGEEPAVLSAMLKYQATERMRATINDAMDVHGGRAVCHGPSNYLFNAYSAVPVAITVEGANILTRTLIVFGQGAIRCHPWLLKEISAAGEKEYLVGLDKFDVAIRGHIADIFSNMARALFKNLTGGLVGSDPSVGEVNYWYAQLERASASFAIVADLSLAQLGGELKRKERLSGRFADAFGQLYLLSASLKRFEDDGRPHNELPVVEYVCTAGLSDFYEAIDGILQNLPSRSSAWLLRRIVFPWGRTWRAPSDRLGNKIADLLVSSLAFRQKLSNGIYFNDSENDVIGCLEHAARLVEESDAAAKKVRSAIANGTVAAYAEDLFDAACEAGVIDTEEVALLRETEIAVRRAIDVDDFSSEELWVDKAA
ncbi:MAG: acyl-CoA dehydrogenase [Gammaproteobacteria bacterium]